MPVYESSLFSFLRVRVRVSPERSDGARRAQFSEMQSHCLRAIEMRRLPTSTLVARFPSHSVISTNSWSKLLLAP